MNPNVKPKEATVRARLVDGSWVVNFENSELLRPRDMNRLDHACRLAYRTSLAERRIRNAQAEHQKLETVSS